MKNRRSLLIIYTGGTSGMITDPVSQSLIPVDCEEISRQLPELNKFDLNLQSYTFDPTVDSSNVTPEVWVKLAQLIGQTYDQFDGFVILTGSQLPIGVLRTDGKENLLSAIEIAAEVRNGQPLVPEVAVFFQNRLFRGNRTTKHNAEYFNAFVSENYPTLAETGIRIHNNYGAIHYPVNPKPLKVHTQIDNRIGILKLFPGISPATVRAILNVIQCPAGRVEPGKYETSRRLHQNGVINGRDSTTEAAVTKLMYLFGQGLSRENCIHFLNRSLCGEITV